MVTHSHTRCMRSVEVTVTRPTPSPGLRHGSLLTISHPDAPTKPRRRRTGQPSHAASPGEGPESSRVCWGLCFLPEPPSWLLEKDLHLTEPSRVCLALVTQCGKTGEEALSKYARHFYPISYRNFRERKKGKKHLHWHNPTTVTQGARRFTRVSSEQCLGS